MTNSIRQIKLLEQISGDVAAIRDRLVLATTNGAKENKHLKSRCKITGNIEARTLTVDLLRAGSTYKQISAELKRRLAFYVSPSSVSRFSRAYLSDNLPEKRLW